MNRWANRVSILLTVGLLAAAGALGWAMKPREAAVPGSGDAVSRRAREASPPATEATPAPAPRRSARTALPPAPVPIGGTLASRPAPNAGLWLESVGAAAESAARLASGALSGANAMAQGAWGWMALRGPDVLAILIAAATGAAAWVVAPLVLILALALRGLTARARRTSRSRVLGMARRGGSAASIARRMGIPQDAVRALMRPEGGVRRGA